MNAESFTFNILQNIFWITSLQPWRRISQFKWLVAVWYLTSQWMFLLKLIWKKLRWTRPGSDALVICCLLSSLNISPFLSHTFSRNFLIAYISNFIPLGLLFLWRLLSLYPAISHGISADVLVVDLIVKYLYRSWTEPQTWFTVWYIPEFILNFMNRLSS